MAATIFVKIDTIMSHRPVVAEKKSVQVTLKRAESLFVAVTTLCCLCLITVFIVFVFCCILWIKCIFGSIWRGFSLKSMDTDLCLCLCWTERRKIKQMLIHTHEWIKGFSHVDPKYQNALRQQLHEIPFSKPPYFPPTCSYRWTAREVMNY